MTYYPINLDLRGKKCLVVGGGDVAVRKVNSLLECGAEVTIVSPEITDDLLKQDGNIALISRRFLPEDLDGVFLVIAATDDRQVNAQVSQIAQDRGILINVVDDPVLCNFIVPATIRRGELQISISTGGASPALAKKIRQDLEKLYIPEYEAFVELLSKTRETVKAKYSDQSQREAAFKRLMDSDILDLIAAGQVEKAKKRAQECI
ncbi:MAG: bifunctional precorrin-2 dehydrogenase/sirohydrochlorin ferrochelatase [Armatimonadota bacterium]|nr:bifunctional precorrin-2 dehydrogenase/sirohydrochlorin ferrochelatase [Armatimonadota bacterium]